MNPDDSSSSTRRYWPLGQMMLARVREFYRQPEAVFWVYGFPLLMMVALGIAFRNQPVEQIAVDVETGPVAADVRRALEQREQFVVEVHDAATGSPNQAPVTSTSSYPVSWDSGCSVAACGASALSPSTCASASCSSVWWQHR